MRKILGLVVLFAMALWAGAASAQSAPKALTLTWTNTDSSWGPVCPATSPTTCLGPIVAEDITSVTPVFLSQAVAYNATTYTYTFPAAPTYGNHTYAVYATGFDASGAAVQSGTASVVVNVEPKLNAVTGLTVTYQ
jgi:hypothetical protein